MFYLFYQILQILSIWSHFHFLYPFLYLCEYVPDTGNKDTIPNANDTCYSKN